MTQCTLPHPIYHHFLSSMQNVINGSIIKVRGNPARVTTSGISTGKHKSHQILLMPYKIITETGDKMTLVSLWKRTGVFLSRNIITEIQRSDNLMLKWAHFKTLSKQYKNDGCRKTEELGSNFLLWPIGYSCPATLPSRIRFSPNKV